MEFVPDPEIEASTPEFLKIPAALGSDDVPIFSKKDVDAAVIAVTQKANEEIDRLRKMNDQLKKAWDKDAAEMEARCVELREQVRAKDNERITASNALFNYKRQVGDTLNEWVQALTLDEEETAGMVAVFKELDLEDYLPMQDWSVEVEVTGKAYISVRAANADLARELVTNSTSTHEVLQELQDSDDVNWETTGSIEPA